MSELAQSVWQGLIQGLTEFLPVSSSGHLAIFQHLTGTGEPSLVFDLVLHLATVCATLLFFAKDIVRLLCEFFTGFAKGGEKKEGWRFGWAVIAGSVPTAAIGLFLEPLVKSLGSSMTAVGAALLATSALMFLLCFIGGGKRDINVATGIAVGIAQGLAVFPGISRSGATIASGILCGLRSPQAFEFSFLLSLPAIVGASLLEFKDIDLTAALPDGWLIASALAFFSGLAALYALRGAVIKGKFLVFGAYCFVLGSAVLFFL